MKASPWPVPEIATTLSRAYTPAPTIGESPTRPSAWPTIPPVDVAAATRPLASRATAPTVPWRAAAARPVHHSLQLLPPRLGDEVVALDHLKSVALKERDIRVDDEGVLGVLHHGAGQPDRVLGVLGRGDRARKPGSCHHRRVELGVSRRGERGAAASVEQRIVLKYFNARADGVQRAAARCEHLPSGANRRRCRPSAYGARPARVSSSTRPPAPPCRARLGPSPGAAASKIFIGDRLSVVRCGAQRPPACRVM